MRRPLLFTVVAASLLSVLAGGAFCSRLSSGATRGNPSESAAQSLDPEAVPTVAVHLRPAVSATGKAANTSSSLFAAPWGSGPAELGRSLPSEGNAEAPMSFSFHGEELIALDQVNHRLTWFAKGGGVSRSVGTGQKAPQDIVVAPNGNVLVLDRLGDRNVTLLDRHANPVGTLPLEGKGLAEGGSVTGMFVDGRDVYAEVDHGKLVLLGDTSGNANHSGKELAGRPSRDGKSLLNAGLIEAEEGRLWVSSTGREDGNLKFTRELRMPSSLTFLVMLDSDLAGTVYLAAHLHDAITEAGLGLQVVCLEPEQGHLTGSVFIPLPDQPEEQFKQIVVLDQGGVVVAIPSDHGMEYKSFACG